MDISAPVGITASRCTTEMKTDMFNSIVSRKDSKYNVEECQVLVWEAIGMVEKWLGQAEREFGYTLPELFVREIVTILSKLVDECNRMKEHQLCDVSLEGLVQILTGFVQVGKGIANDLQLKGVQTLIQCLTHAMKNVAGHMPSNTDKFKVDSLSHPLEYTSRKVLGKGGYGEVREAKWMGLIVAVKEFLFGQESLDRELHVLRRTGHINIIRMIGYIPYEVQVAPKACLLMERMAGDLDTFINDNSEQMKAAQNFAQQEEFFDNVMSLQTDPVPLHLGICIEILLQIATGMAYLHKQEIIHRDLKPGNILLNKWPPRSSEKDIVISGFTVKITDFGVARPCFATGDLATRNHGTRHYRAPEVKKGNDDEAFYSKKVDVYSFGKLSYKVCTGCDPDFDGPIEVRVVPPQSCPPAMIYLMKRCLDEDHKKRPDFSDICDFLAIFKAKILLIPPPRNGDPMCLLYPEIKYELLEKLVGFLGRNWLYKETISHLELTSCFIRYEGRQILNQVLQALPIRCVQLAWHFTTSTMTSLRTQQGVITKRTVNIAVLFSMCTILSFVFLTLHQSGGFGFTFWFLYNTLYSGLYSVLLDPRVRACFRVVVVVVIVLACFSWCILVFGVGLVFDSLWTFLTQQQVLSLILSWVVSWTCFWLLQRVTNRYSAF